MAGWVIKKLGIIVGSSVATVATFAGISVGVVNATSASSNFVSTNPNEEINNETPNTNSSNPQTDSTLNTTSVERIDFNSYFNEVEKSLSIYKSDDKSSGIDKQKTFAYQITKQQLGLSNTTLNNDVSIEYEIDSSNTISDLNEGILKVRTKLTSLKHSDQSEEKVITLQGFKKASAELKSFFEKNGQEQTYGLNLSKKEAQEQKADGPLFTVDDLNIKVQLTPPVVTQTSTGKQARLNQPGTRTAVSEQKTVTSLSSFFWDKNKSSNSSIGDFTIEGEVKLATITKSDEGNLLFKLVSAKKNDPLRIVKKTKDASENETEEALIESITLSNLAATNIALIPKNTKEAYLEEFKTKANGTEASKPYLTDKGDKDINQELALNLNGSGLENLLFINPFSVAKPDDKQDDFKLLFDLSISFGKGETAKTFRTDKAEDLALLKELGFSFDIYSKKLSEAKDEKSSAEAIKKVATAIKVFDVNNHNKLIEKPVASDQKLTVNEIKNPSVEKVFELTIKKQGGEGEGQEALEGNYLLFVGYKYPKIYNKDEENKTLFTSCITYLNLTSASKLQ